jgi:hypothetical protein
LFEVCWASLAESALDAFWVVEAFGVVEQGGAQFGA